MPHDKAGPKELALRAQREEKAAKPRPLIPYAGTEKDRRPKGGRPKGSPNQPKPKEPR